ncbi:MAG: histidine phosphatase family protein [Thermoanaerobaculia bacterium]|nr:histidine phosphatase family protein [Thermoanaerobaculia bacterium]
MANTTGNEEEEEGQRDRFIVLLRHGIAEEKTEEKTDEERSLTSEGHARMKQIAKGIERAFPKAQVIYSSPLLRAVQTALWVSKGYRSRIKVNTSDALIPGATPEEFSEFLSTLKERRIIIVGHEPNLTDNVMELIGAGAGQPVELKKGGCYGVRLRTEGGGMLEWLLSPRILRKLTEGD